MNRNFACTIVLAALAGCGSEMTDSTPTTPQSPEAAQVTGTLFFRERIALQPGATAEVWLLDTSRADVAATELAYQKIDDPGNPPIPFVLDYDPQQIDDRMQYSVRATIRHGDRLLFTTDRHHPVLTRGAGSTTEVLLVMVDRAATRPDASLTNTYWKLTAIGRAPYRHAGEQREPHLKFIEQEKTARGETGCNSFTGGYDASGSTLAFGNLAVTQRACIDGMDTERAFLDGLGAANRFEIVGDTLTLYAGDEAVLGFEAVWF